MASSNKTFLAERIFGMRINVTHSGLSLRPTLMQKVCHCVVGFKYDVDFFLFWNLKIWKKIGLVDVDSLVRLLIFLNEITAFWQDHLFDFIACVLFMSILITVCKIREVGFYFLSQLGKKTQNLKQWENIKMRFFLVAIVLNVLNNRCSVHLIGSFCTLVFQERFHTLMICAYMPHICF